MLDGYRRLGELKASETSTIDVSRLEEQAYEALDDDLNTPVLIGVLFDAVRMINQVKDHTATATQTDIDTLRAFMDTFLVDILGIRPDEAAAGNPDALRPYHDAVDLLLELRADAKSRKDWATSDLIRNRMAEIGFTVKDTKDGVEWSL